jgi:hypothetical protein
MQGQCNGKWKLKKIIEQNIMDKDKTDGLSNKTDINADKFEAALYTDLNLVKQLVKSKEDLRIAVPIPKDYEWMWNSERVYVSVLDMLNWLAYGLYEYHNESEICHKSYNAKGKQVLNDCINPSIIYKKAIDCINWICDKFSIVNYDLKDYSQYRLLRHVLFDNEGWLDDDEIKEALQKGFKQIDLNLINEAEKGNGISVYTLVKQGANYKIDPEDDTDESSIASILGTDLSYHSSSLISYLSHRDKYSFSDSYDILSSLYQVGVSNYILDIVMMNEIENNPKEQ